MNITHDDLIKKGIKWLKSRKGQKESATVILSEIHSFANEIPDIIGFSNWNTTVIECKVSLNDFKSDLKKPHRKYLKKLGNFRYYLCPNDLIPIEDIPGDWGLLYFHGTNITIEKEAPHNNGSEIKAAEYSILYSLVRRASVKRLLPELVKY